MAEPLDFIPISDPNPRNVVAENGRAWAYHSDNVWRLVDINTLKFTGVSPIVTTATLANGEVETEIDLDTLTKPPSA